MRTSIWKKKGQKGFTIVELMVTSTVSVMSLGLVYTAFIGMQTSARTTIEQVRMRQHNQDTLKRLGRFVMEASKVEVKPEEAELGIVHLWKDEQLAWTPETTEDDTEGMIFFEESSERLMYRKDVNQLGADELVAPNLQRVTFEMVGKALFVELTMDYDVDDKISREMEEAERAERNLYVSYAVRNNPRIRIGASQ
jgi:prepilin-type N-terminal cleavage/methylation domain-containing protein